MNQLDDHPLANIFPLIEGEEFASLVADIKASGLHDPIDVYQGKILDGRNRYRALLAAGIEFETRHLRTFRPEFYGDPLAYVISKNLKRRHLNDDQRRVVAAKLVNIGRGRPSENPAECGIKVEEAARLINTDQPGTERARTMLAQAEPEIITAAEQGKLSVNSAVKAAKFTPATQRRIAAEAEAGHANVVRTVIKQEARAVRESELGAEQQAFPEKKYGVILADPEWKFEPWSQETGMDRAPENHYPTSELCDIAARDVLSIAADDGVLYLWGLIHMLPQALSVMRAWGFDYKSAHIWGKDKIGLGYWARENCEILLIGTRGKPPAPAPGTQRNHLIMAARGEHSAKPECFLEMIERHFPTLPKIELNRRGAARPGWDAWGNEVIESDATPAGAVMAARSGVTLADGEQSAGEIIDGAPQMGAVTEPAPAIAAAATGAGHSSVDEFEIPEFLKRTP